MFVYQIFLVIYFENKNTSEFDIRVQYIQKKGEENSGKKIKSK